MTECYCSLSIRWAVSEMAWKKCTMNSPPVFHIISCNEIAVTQNDMVHSHLLIYTEIPLVSAN